MKEEIDLREYIYVLIRHWYWIAGLALAAAVVAFGVSSFLPPTYEATSLVIVAPARDRSQIGTQAAGSAQVSRDYQSIAASDDLLLSVAKAAAQPKNVGDLRDDLVAQTGSDPNLIKLTAHSQDPQEAAELANLWAGQLADYLNRVYGTYGDLPALERQTAEAKTALEQADLALATFRQKYGMGFSDSGDSGNMALDPGVARQLRVKTDLLTQYETQSDRTARLLQEARTAAARADGATSPAIVAGLLADMVTLGLMDKESSPPVQINLGDLDARASLSALIAALEAKQDSADAAIARLRPEVEALQSELADRQQELDQLLRNRQMTQGTYLTLSSQFRDAGIQAQNKTGDVAQVGSRAAAPGKAVGPQRLLNTAVAGALGLVAGVLGAFFVEYWRQGTPEPAAAGEPPVKQTAGE